MWMMPTGLSASVHDQRGNRFFVEDGHRRAGERVGRHRFRRTRHDFASGKRQQVAADVAAQVAVGDDAGQCSVGAGDGDAAEALGRDYGDGLGHRRRLVDHRHAIAAVHDFVDMGEVGAERAAGMKDVKIARRKAAPLQ